MISSDYSIIVNGVDSAMLGQADALVRSVVISLFTWRRANQDDVTEGQKMGWWGDVAEPSVVNDKIGSRLWLLSRETIRNSTINRAREYCEEALQWLVDDKVASQFTVLVERLDITSLAIGIVVYRNDGTKLDLKFNNAWEIIRAV